MKEFLKLFWSGDHFFKSEKFRESSYSCSLRKQIVTRDEKWVYYRNHDASKQWLDPRQPAKVIVKKLVSVPKYCNDECLVEFWKCDSLRVVPKECAVDTDLYSQQLERVHEILRRISPALVNPNRVILQQDNAILHSARTPRQKFRNWEKSNCYHTQHTALCLRLLIIIFFEPWPISCVEEISKTLKLWKWISSNSSHQISETDTVAG